MCGPKVRTGTFATPSTLVTGTTITLIEGDHSDDANVVAIQQEGLHQDVRVDDTILFDDGRIVLRATKVDDTGISAVVEQGGAMRNHVGVHLPSRSMRVGALTEKDKRTSCSGSPRR